MPTLENVAGGGAYIEIYVEACGSLFEAAAVAAKRARSRSPLILLLLVNASKRRQLPPPSEKVPGPLTPSLAATVVGRGVCDDFFKSRDKVRKLLTY